MPKNFHTELLQEIGAFDNLTVEELIPGKLCVQQYSYIEGDHKSRNISSFLGVCNSLKKLHEKKFVHSDVRINNIIFSSETSRLIDYDLAQAEGTLYPANYVFDIYICVCVSQ